MYAKNQGPNSKDGKVILLTLFNIVLKEVMYAIKRDLLGLSRPLLGRLRAKSCMQKTGIVAYRGNV